MPRDGEVKGGGGVLVFDEGVRGLARYAQSHVPKDEAIAVFHLLYFECTYEYFLFLCLSLVSYALSYGKPNAVESAVGLASSSKIFFCSCISNGIPIPQPGN